MKSKFLFTFALLSLVTAMVPATANFTSNASANDSYAQLNGTGPLLHTGLNRPAALGAKSNDRGQHCGTKDVDETVAVELQSLQPGGHRHTRSRPLARTVSHFSGWLRRHL